VRVSCRSHLPLPVGEGRGEGLLPDRHYLPEVDASKKLLEIKEPTAGHVGQAPGIRRRHTLGAWSPGPAAALSSNPKDRAGAVRHGDYRLSKRM
jgi:hypothetical protein